MKELHQFVEWLSYPSLLQRELSLSPASLLVFEQILHNIDFFAPLLTDNSRSPEETKKLIFTAVANKYIQGNGPKTELRREVFIKGRIGNLRQLASELGISWEKCINIYSEGLEEYSKQVFRDKFY